MARPIPHAPADDDCPMPSSNRDPSGAFDRFNVEAWRIYCAESVGETCDVCHAPFADVDAKLKHARDCVEINRWFGAPPPNFRTL